MATAACLAKLESSPASFGPKASASAEYTSTTPSMSSPAMIGAETTDRAGGPSSCWQKDYADDEVLLIRILPVSMPADDEYRKTDNDAEQFHDCVEDQVVIG